MGNAFENMLQKIKQKPTANDIMPKELQSFLEHYGFVLARIKGDHYIYKFANQRSILSIPMHKPVKPTYIDQIRKMIEIIEGE